MNISDILRNATPEQLEEIRAFMDSLDGKSWNRPFTKEVEPVQEISPVDVQHETGNLGCYDVYRPEGEKLCGWISLCRKRLLQISRSSAILGIDEKRAEQSKEAHKQAERFIKPCGLKFVYEFKKFKFSDSPRSNFPFF